MLGKLIKNEFRSYYMPLGITFLAAVIFTIFMKIVCMLPYQEDAKETIQIFGFYGYYYIIMMMNIVVSVLIIVRFYTTMVADRGYLTWTLPVKSSTHIWAKLIGGMLWKIIAGCAVVALFTIFLWGRYWVIWDDFAMEFTLNEANILTIVDIAKQLIRLIQPEYVITMFLVLITILIYQVMPQLMIYFCIAIGQLFGKWRIVVSIGCYFVIVILLEIFVILGVSFTIVGGTFVGNVVGFFESMSVASMINIVLCIIFAVGMVLSVVFFLLTNMVFKKHLNLE